MERKVLKYKNNKIVSGGETIICGIVNVTPDSFSDGGKWFEQSKAVERALMLVEEGAGMLDIGGESTRPGSTHVGNKDEIDRIIPVIKELKDKVGVPISVDTWHADVAQAAIEAGADIINDITGLLGDPKMAEVVGNSDAGLILMFNPVIARPGHKSSQNFPSFGGDNVFTTEELTKFQTMNIEDIMVDYFEKAIELGKQYGIEKDRIQLDPGIGFGLTKKENLTLINKMNIIHDMGHQIFLGVSRKRFIVNILMDAGFNLDADTNVGHQNRDAGSAVLTAMAAAQGVEVVRVHTVKEHKMAQVIADHVRLSDSKEDIHLDSYQN